MSFVKEPTKQVLVNTNIQILNESTQTNNHLSTFDFNQDTTSIGTFFTQGIEQNNNQMINNEEKNLNQENNTMSDISSKGTNRTMATRVSTMEQNMKSLTEMMSKVRNYMRTSNHNVDDNQEKLPTSDVVTPSPASAEEGSAL